MPIIQISEIRHRRGLKQDLPNLAEGEIGLTIDTGEVFIGTPMLPSVERDVIAFVWKPLKAYEAGDFVAYGGKLYRCKTDHNSTPTFAGAFWVEVDDSNYTNPNTRILTEWSKNIETVLRYSFLQRNQRLNPTLTDSNSTVQEIDDFYADLPDTWPYQAVRRVGSNSYEEFAVRRYLQERLDEQVSVLSYGATGNGRADLVETGAAPRSRMDAEANAIRRAVVDLSNINRDDVGDGEIGERNRALHFPGGTYVVNKTVFLTSRTSLLGDGPGKTRIVFNINGLTLDEISNTLFTTIGTSEQSGNHVTIGVGSVINPTDVSQHVYQNISTPVRDIFVSGITFEIFGTPASGSTVKTADIIRLIRARNVLFHNCEFVGNWDNEVYHPNAYTPSSDGQGVAIDSVGDSQTGSSPLACSDITFDNCRFTHLYYVANLTDAIDGINYTDCTFDNCYRGIFIGESPESTSAWITYPPADSLRNGPRGVRVCTSNFRNIASNAVYVYRGYQGDGVDRPVSYVGYETGPKTTGELPFDQVSGVVLSGNHYMNVGNYHLDVLLTIEENAEERAIVPVVKFDLGSNYNMSMGEVFSRDITVGAGNRHQSRVWYDPNDPNIIMNPQDLVFFRTAADVRRSARINPSTDYVDVFPKMVLNDLTTNPSENTFSLIYTIVYADITQTTSTVYRRRVGTMLITVDSHTDTATFHEDYAYTNGPDTLLLRAVVNPSRELVIQSHFTNTFPITTHAIMYYKLEAHLSPNAT